MTKHVSGTYHEQRNISDAIVAMIDVGVPVEELEVIVEEPSGRMCIPIRRRPRGLRGALIGGAICAIAGALGALVLAHGGAGPDAAEAFRIHPISALLLGLLVGGGSGALLGMFIGLDLRRRDVKLTRKDLAVGATLIVHSDGRAAAAKRVLQSTGAEHISIAARASRA